MTLVCAAQTGAARDLGSEDIPPERESEHSGIYPFVNVGTLMISPPFSAEA